MATYTAVVSWERGNQAFVDRQYSTAERIAGVSMEAWTFRRHPPRMSSHCRSRMPPPSILKRYS